MLTEAQGFWEAISGKVKQLIRGETKNTFKCERYEVTTAPNGGQIGVTLPYGSNEIFLPYSDEVSNASVGDQVLVVWWGSMSNAKVYYFANGYNGGGGASVVIATISLPLNWNNSGNGYYTVTPTISNATISAASKIDLQPDETTIQSLQSNGVTALYVENNAGALTAYAVGSAPSAALTMQCSITEAEAASAPINPALDTVYPVGSIYLSVSSVDPNNVFGGTWVRIKDTFLLAAGDTYTAGDTGGEAEHLLTTTELPSNMGKLAPMLYPSDGTTNGIFSIGSQQKDTSWSSGNKYGTAQINVSGGNQAHNNMPPYLAVYMWKRTA